MIQSQINKKSSLVVSDLNTICLVRSKNIISCSMKSRVLGGFRNLVGLFFPRICVACEENVPTKGKMICLTCQNELEYTNHHFTPKNDFESHFLGRIPLVRGAAMFFYRKDTAIQSILQQLKYQGNKDIGIQLGVEYAQVLSENNMLSGIDYIVPVPLHWRKQKQRGYNQAEAFGNGISLTSGIPQLTDLITKIEESASQTRMSRGERVENVSNVFAINEKYNMKGKHVLIVDDVLTTGATLEACAKKLNLNEVKVSMVTIAIGRM